MTIVESDSGRVLQGFFVSTICHFVGWVLLIIIAPFALIGLIPLCLWSSTVDLLSKFKFIVGTKLAPGSRLAFFDMVFATDKVYKKPFAANMTFFVIEGRVDLKTIRDNFVESVLNKKVKGKKYSQNDGGGKTSSAINSDSTRASSPKLREREVIDMFESEKKDKTSAESASVVMNTEGLPIKVRDLYQFHRLRQVPRPFLNYYFWTDVESLDLSAHIREIPQKVTSDRELSDLLSNLMMTPFPKGSALWELLLIREFCGDKSVVVLRVHHVIADGYSFNRIVDEMIGERSRYIVKEPQISWRQQLQLILTTPGWALNFFLEELLLTNFSNRRKKNVDGVLSMTTIPLDQMKFIRKKLNCHFATVGMSLLGGALRRFYLESRINSSSSSSQSLPQFIKIMHLLPKPDHPLERMCNHWNAGCFKIPLRTEKALERLLEAEAHFKFHTENHYDRLVNLQSPFASLMPAFVYKIFLAGNYGTSMALTSLPAFQGSAHLWSHKVTNMFKICGLQYKQSALTAALYSHNGQVAYTIFANKEFIPGSHNAQRLTVHLHEELNQLLKELEEQAHHPGGDGGGAGHLTV